MKGSARPTRNGFAVPVVLLALTVTLLAAAGAGWTALALRRADQSAALTDRRWQVADSLLRTVRCERPLVPGEARVWIRSTEAGVATFRLRHALGACWFSVAVGDTVPVVGAFVAAEDSAVTLVASGSPLALPSIDGATEFPARSPATALGPTPVDRPPWVAWRDLR